MAADVLSCSLSDPDTETIRRAADVLRDGGLVAIPTETVYGLGGNALDPSAVAAIFRAKGRPATDPLIVHVDGATMLERVVIGDLPEAAGALIEAYWPGPLTLVLPRHPRVPAAVSSGLDTVAVRCPSHPIAAAIITEAATPIAAPSANRFGHISPTAAEHVIDELGRHIDLIIDAGRADRGLESTVVAFEGDEAVILRPGAVTIEQLAAHVDVRPTAGGAAASPGHDERHYSPRTPTLTVVSDFDTDAIPALPGGRYVGYDERPPALPDGWRFEPLGSLEDLEAVAHDLYDHLRRLDAQRPALIVVELTGRAGIGAAIDDRLTRAGSSRVLTTADQIGPRVGLEGP